MGFIILVAGSVILYYIYQYDNFLKEKKKNPSLTFEEYLNK